MTLLDFVRLLVRSWLIVIAAPIIGGLLGFLIARGQPPSYQSTALLLVTATPQSSAADGQSANLFAQSRAQLLAQLATSDRVLGAVQARLPVRESLEELRRSVSADAVESTNFTSISASADSRQLAASITNYVAEQVRDSGEIIDSALVQGRPERDIRVEVVSLGRAPRIAFAPQPRNYVLAGGGAALALALAAVLLRDLLSRRVWGPDDVRALAPETPVVALRRTGRRLGRGREPWRGEDVRYLRNDIIGLVGDRAQVVMVTVGRQAVGARLGAALGSALMELRRRFAAADDPGAAIAVGPPEAPVSVGFLRDGADGRDGWPLEVYGSLLDGIDDLVVSRDENLVVLHLQAGAARTAATRTALEHLERVGARPGLIAVSNVRAADAADTTLRPRRERR